MRRLSVVVFALLVSPTLAAQTNAGATSTPIVAVSGAASKSIPADHATVYISVETHASTAEQAGRENARVQQAVVAALRGAGGDSVDLSGAGYIVRPDNRSEFSAQPATPTGYVANNTVHIEVRRLDRIGALIDTALAAGANRVSGINFTSSAEREARRSVLAEAVANARSDAEAIATAAGGSRTRAARKRSSSRSRRSAARPIDRAQYTTGRGSRSVRDATGDNRGHRQSDRRWTARSRRKSHRQCEVGVRAEAVTRLDALE